MQVQWFPGHMAKTKRMIQEQLKLVDVVIELVDARMPISSRNPLLDQLVGDKKPRIIILNKEDLADPQRTAYWINQFNQQSGYRAFAFNATIGKKQLISRLKEALLELTKEKRERMAQKGVRKQTIRCMIVGIPNVGKSTFINILVGKKAAQTGDKPGVTRGTQWIRLDEDLELLDTPGILWPKFEDQTVGMHLAWIGSIKDELLNKEELAMKLIKELAKGYPGCLNERYGVCEEEEPAAIFQALCESRGCLKKGGGLDYGKAAALLLDEFRGGRLGRITVEAPPAGSWSE